jgi:predicted helicase
MFNTTPWSPDEANGKRVPNLNPAFVADMEQKLGLTFQPFKTSQVADVFTPEDIFHYIYAVFHSPTYRERYAEFLKIDFPRVPLTDEVMLFRVLVELGQNLVGLHLLESPVVNQFITTYPKAGDNPIPEHGGWPKYTPTEVGTTNSPGRVHINEQQYFEGVPSEVWEFQIGGYQVLHKWLKDRRGRSLTYDELTHYQQIVVALQETIALMAQIDEKIPAWFD